MMFPERCEKYMQNYTLISWSIKSMAKNDLCLIQMSKESALDE